MKDVLITGAGGGMGRKTAEQFVSSGYRVFALDLKPGEASGNVIPVACDVTDEKSVAAAFDFVRARTEQLVAIVHLAGIYMLDSLVEMPAGKFKRAFRVNLLGAFLINRAFLSLLPKGGKILMVTSELAVRDPLPFTGIYGITKTSLDKYAYSLRMELQLLGIYVSVLRAGAVGTGMLSESTRQLDEFCQRTELYSLGAGRFRNIVDKVEARRVPPEKIAAKVFKIVGAKKPRFAYSINRNPLLIIIDKLPKGARFFTIRKILTGGGKYERG